MGLGPLRCTLYTSECLLQVKSPLSSSPPPPPSPTLYFLPDLQASSLHKNCGVTVTLYSRSYRPWRNKLRLFKGDIIKLGVVVGAKVWVKEIRETQEGI